MKNAKRAGTKREHQVADVLRSEGWIVYRSAGSHGCADLVAMRVGFPPMLVQVKGNAGGPWEHFRPVERRELEAEAIMAGATAHLVHWPPRHIPRWYGRLEWPGNAGLESHLAEIDHRLQAGVPS